MGGRWDLSEGVGEEWGEVGRDGGGWDGGYACGGGGG